MVSDDPYSRAWCLHPGLLEAHPALSVLPVPEHHLSQNQFPPQSVSYCHVLLGFVELIPFLSFVGPFTFYWNGVINHIISQRLYPGIKVNSRNYPSFTPEIKCNFLIPDVSFHFTLLSSPCSSCLVYSFTPSFSIIRVRILRTIRRGTLSSTSPGSFFTLFLEVG